MTRDSFTDAMSIVLQDAARKETKRVWPIRSGLSEDSDKLIDKLLRRKFIKRVKVEGIEQFHKNIRGMGPCNYEITKSGLKQINWE